VNSLVAPISQPPPSGASLLVDVLGGTDISPQPLGGNTNKQLFNLEPELHKGLKK